MKTNNFESIISELKIRVQELEIENKYLREFLKSFTLAHDDQELVAEYIGNSFLKDAIEKADNSKWIEASLIISKQYGNDFMIKESVSFSILKKAMYEFYKMPKAPLRNDKSIDANWARDRRKTIRAMVYTYIDRMGDYYMKHLEKQENN